MAPTCLGPTLPTELLNDIALRLYEERRVTGTQCKNADLLSFSKASRHFYQVAVPLIYREVCLQDTERAACCIQTLLSNDLAAVSVKRLALLGTLFRPSTVLTEQPAVNSWAIGRALERLPNLLTLRMEPSLQATKALFEFHGVEGWKEIVEDIFVPKGTTTYPFQLSTFVTSLPSDENLNTFLAHQNGINNMSFRGQLPGAEWKPAALPALRQLAFSVHEQSPNTVQGFLDGLRLQHVTIDTQPHGNQKADPEAPYIMELRPTLIPLVQQIEDLETVTFRAGLTDLLKLMTSRTGMAEPAAVPRKPLHISCLFDPSMQYDNVDCYVTITMVIIALASGHLAPLKSLKFNILPPKAFLQMHGLVTNVSPVFMTETDSFDTYFYNPEKREAKRLFVKKFTPSLEWAYEDIPYETIPQTPGTFFNYNTEEKWQRFPESECNLSLR